MTQEDAPQFPDAQGDPLGTPADDETVLWQGRPNTAVLARTAFHTYSMAIYFAALAALAVALGRYDAATFVAVFGAGVIALFYAAAWLTVRNTLYILTDARLIMRVGMAVDKRINVPLKKVTAAHFADRGKGYGDIALELGDKTVLGYLLLWPHARPWHISHPQPMLRALPDAQAVAQHLASASAQFNAIERGDFEAGTAGAQTASSASLAGASA